MIKTLLLCIVALLCSLVMIDAAAQSRRGELTTLTSVIDARRKDPDHETSLCHSGYDDCYDGHCCIAGGECCAQRGTCCGRGYYCVNNARRQSGCCPKGHVCEEP
ncbi:uncharacterized protein BX664DRAFT_376693 [Halteromyces radiatus]|uniref:uncharacterized protein n=1 Tax=Halteromyces radiatus TaxID=101107 RepID=UPI00221EB7B6|nr:uncharacterized protein BX664DRAFT_376693 [Halteromyces radiatus]KAI8079950.1 hypothetical protein BX664DRAFT_376693 [Halteromyces radiatus]